MNQPGARRRRAQGGHREVLVVGVDIGTGGCRAVVVAPEGAVLGSAQVAYPLLSPAPGVAEQDPRAILAAVLSTVREAIEDADRGRPGATCRSAVGAIALSSVFHSLVVVDRAGEPLTNLITWADARSLPQVRQLKAELDADAIYRRTGCPLHPIYWPGKVRWFQESHPELAARARKYLSIKDYVVHALTGEYAADLSVVSGSGLLNLTARTWDTEVLLACALDPDRLPRLVPPAARLPLLPSAAHELGLEAGTELVVGAGDGVLANVGCGAVSAGMMALTIGTSGAVRLVTGEPKLDREGRTWCYLMDERLAVAGAAINNGGIVLRWLRDSFCEPQISEAARLAIDPYELLTSLAATVPPGAEGLLFLPFLAGERSPYWNAEARGVLCGLTLRHNRAHVARATLEGIGFRIGSVYRALIETAGEPAEIRATGGFTRSPLWVQIIADLLGREITLTEVDEGSAFGAALLGQVALGIVPDLASAARSVRLKPPVAPDPERHTYYRRLLDLFLELYGQVSPSFPKLSAVSLSGP
ncbi:MAG: gluconokinase [Betaproteobacteria bacterium]